MVKTIYPKHPETEEKPPEKTTGFNKVTDTREINKYVSFEYDSLVDEDDFKNVEDSDGNYYYLIKICIKPGHPE